ncbi:MAG: bifunctional 4-hydroxy-2-oxoglutarate aldolase/2-dehydro-3-deoxy-phosphogluconate aldolase [Verrucomicrobia bacterium]|nr:bifunctional 4-hydroxy-2-oxoglutarate aldolase/2-dehydro-3-deoxy-phosphogluconate aldolase [Verrucomicrobiota bacterium]
MFTLSTATAQRLIPVAVIDKTEDAVPLAAALQAGGLNVIEVTLRSACAIDAIAAIRRQFPDFIVGAGTVIDVEVVAKLRDLGVHFAVSPGLNPLVLEATQAAGIPLVPGAITPTEIERARSLGVQTIKFFPAEAAGGSAMLKALTGPYGHTGIQFIPTGGIDAAKLKDYLNIPAVAAVGGSWFVDKKWLKAGDFAKITALTAEAVALAHS